MREIISKDFGARRIYEIVIMGIHMLTGYNYSTRRRKNTKQVERNREREREPMLRDLLVFDPLSDISSFSLIQPFIIISSDLRSLIEISRS